MDYHWHHWNTLWWTNIAMENNGKSPFFMGKSTINIYKWPFSIAMLVHQRVSFVEIIPNSILYMNFCYITMNFDDFWCFFLTQREKTRVIYKLPFLSAKSLAAKRSKRPAAERMGRILPMGPSSLSSGARGVAEAMEKCWDASHDPWRVRWSPWVSHG